MTSNPQQALLDEVDRYVAKGTFASRDEALKIGLDQFRHYAEQLEELRRSLDEAAADAERNGTLSADEVWASLNEMLDSLDLE
jgi:Arc/MetJ-type ribon-helix-helix transcriptional regulator